MRAAACGGGEELTLEEYFQRVEAASDDFQKGADALEQDSPSLDDFDSVDEVTEAMRDNLDASLLLFTEFADELEDIDPPAEVRDEHDELVVAVNGLAEAFGDVDFEGLLSQLEAVESVSDVEELFGQLFGSEFIAALERMDNACSDLKVIASDNSFDLDLECAG